MLASCLALAGGTAWGQTPPDRTAPDPAPSSPLVRPQAPGPASGVIPPPATGDTGMNKGIPPGDYPTPVIPPTQNPWATPEIVPK